MRMLLLRRLRINMASQALIPGHLVSQNELSRDTGQRVSIPGHPGQAGTDGNTIARVQLSVLIHIMMPISMFIFLQFSHSVHVI
jgi:hypothetical protein